MRILTFLPIKDDKQSGQPNISVYGIPEHAYTSVFVKEKQQRTEHRKQTSPAVYMALGDNVVIFPRCFTLLFAPQGA